MENRFHNAGVRRQNSEPLARFQTKLYISARKGPEIRSLWSRLCYECACLQMATEPRP
jgi:hypothetical protein